MVPFSRAAWPPHVLVPTEWLVQMLAVSSQDAVAFLLRRYGASATAALFVLLLALARGAAPLRAADGALAVWFAVQGAVAVWRLSQGMVGGLTWFALVADPAIAAGFLVLWRSTERSPAPLQ